MNRRLFLGVREGVRRFLGAEERPASVVASPTPSDRPAAALASPANGPRPAPPDQAFVSAGRFGLIGLQDLREALGARWPELRERVSDLAETVISRHLTPGDVFELQEDGAYVVLFARLNKTEADFKCRVIGKEITQKLLGSESVRLADVSSISVSVSREALAAGSAEVLESAFSRATPIISSDPESPRPAAGPALPESDERSTPPKPPDDPASPVRGAAAVCPLSHASTAAPRGSGWRYSPVWDLKSNSMVRFRLTTADWRASGVADLSHENRRTVAFETDTRALAKAVDDLSTLTAEGRRLFVICVVSQTSLGVEWRRNQLIELLANAPPVVRHLLQVDVFSPVFEPNSALGRFIEALSGLGVRTGVTVPLESREAVRPAGMALNASSVEVPENLSQAQAFSLLNTFARRSAQVGLESAAHGLGVRPIVIGAMAAGIRFLSGEAVHADTQDLNHGLRFEALNLYRDLPSAPAA